MGGAIYFKCLPTSGLNCQLRLNQKNAFVNNSASNSGGAIAYTNKKFIDDGTTQYVNNSAAYGSSYSSFPQNLGFQFISNNDYINTHDYLSSNKQAFNKERNLETNILGKFIIVSGIGFSFTITMYDQEGKQMLEENSAVASLKLNQTFGISEIVLSNNEAVALKGIFNFSNVLLIAKPGSKIDNPVLFLAETRLCIAGEQYTTDHRCNKCPIYTYNYFPPLNATICKACSMYAQCFNGTSVSPISGYWRSSNTSESFIRCPRVESCQKGNQLNPLGQCSEGYEGIVCANCKPGFSKISNFQCSKCPSATQNTIKLFFILLCAVLVVVFLVRSTLLSADKQKPVYSVYLKIIANHFQLIGTISNIEFSWPYEIQMLQDSQQQVSGVSEQIFSFDCFLMGDDQQESQDAEIYYMKLIFYAVLPAMLSLIALLYWLLHSAIKRSFVDMKNSLISTIVILLFLIHPNIAKSMFSSFNCMDIDGELRLMPDLSQKCFQGSHSGYILAVSFPSVIIWALGIPAFALILLMRNRKIILQIESSQNLSKADKWTIKRIKTRLGFLFNGYKIKTFYWEIVILYRKILIVMITVFLSSISPETQVLVGLIVILISILLQVKFRPYYTSTLNTMESYSLLVSAVTLYSGMFYITGKYYKYMENDGVKWFFLICIALPNAIFLGYWTYNMGIEFLKLILQQNRPKLFRLLTCARVDITRFKRKYMKEVKNQFNDDEEDDQEDIVDDNYDRALKYRIDQTDPSQNDNLLQVNDTRRTSGKVTARYTEIEGELNQQSFLQNDRSNLQDDFSFIGDQIQTVINGKNKLGQIAIGGVVKLENDIKTEKEARIFGDPVETQPEVDEIKEQAEILDVNDIKVESNDDQKYLTQNQEQTNPDSIINIQQVEVNLLTERNKKMFEDSFGQGMMKIPKLKLESGFKTSRNNNNDQQTFRSSTSKVFPLDQLYKLGKDCIEKDQKILKQRDELKARQLSLVKKQQFTQKGALDYIQNVDNEKEQEKIHKIEMPVSITKRKRMKKNKNPFERDNAQPKDKDFDVYHRNQQKLGETLKQSRILGLNKLQYETDEENKNVHQSTQQVETLVNRKQLEKKTISKASQQLYEDNLKEQDVQKLQDSNQKLISSEEKPNIADKMSPSQKINQENSVQIVIDDKKIKDAKKNFNKNIFGKKIQMHSPERNQIEDNKLFLQQYQYEQEIQFDIDKVELQLDHTFIKKSD
ncbi:UNKNOWN [Stylonychia lemnae]|uniref:Transmembrane protein n=1 Tax=Stylonychia lemnae TaxID=5949 RepID=A0A077ZTD4_STYLE|nr:UNKNOWN [Stylonychia lemnae]|eukprot:CDW73142.1 UNKNOWN [Stylonychia lemnae]